VRLRVVYGTLLALTVIGLVLADAWIAGRGPVSPQASLDVQRWLGNGLLVTLLIAALALAATRELIQFAQHRGYRPLRLVCYFFGATMAVGPYVSFNLSPTSTGYNESWGVLWLAVALAASFLVQAVRRGTEQVMANISTTIFIIFYAGGLAGYMTKLRMEIGGADGAILLLFSMLLVKITDVGAYFIGSAIGRTPFIPWLSPKKTWEGVLGGIATAVLVAVGVGAILRSQGILTPRFGFFETHAGLAVLGLILAAFSVAGDLCESLLKRDAAIKDSGDSIPGLGGFMDVMDSPLLSAPVAWFIWTRVATLH
jgi:phosphatidate cytidylyltransferase